MPNDKFIGPIPSAAGRGASLDRVDVEGTEAGILTRAEYAEPASRGKIFASMTAAAGTTLVSGNVQPPAAAAATVLTLWNPLASLVNLEIVRAWILTLTGTPAAGGWFWCVSAGNTITATPNNQGTAQLLPTATDGSGASPNARAFVQTALTGGLVHTLLRPFPKSLFAGAVAATTPLVYIDEVKGSIIVRPGGLLTLAPAAIGTTHVVVAGIEHQEVLRT